LQMASDASKDVKKDDSKKEEKKGLKKEEEVFEEPELSEEDQKLKDDLEELVKKLETKKGVQSLVDLKKLIREATSSMSQVPKPLKFLMGMFDDIKGIYDRAKGNFRQQMADLLSVLSMTNSEGKREVLTYRLESKDQGLSFEEWGHEYVRHIVLDVGTLYQEITTEENHDPKDPRLQEIKALIPTLCSYLIQHKTEEACDLLLEVEQLDLILEHVTPLNYERITLYLVSCSDYLHIPVNRNALVICYKIFMKLEKPIRSLRMAIKLDDSEKVKDIFLAYEDELVRKQLAYYLTWCQYPLPFSEEDQEDLWGDDAFDDFEDILSNKNMHEIYLELARELDVMAPKGPEDVYKEHLVNIRSTNDKVLSARKNLASTYVNAFVNCGYQSDKLMTAGENDRDKQGNWIWKNKDAGMLAASASLGLINFWSPDAVNKLEPYSTSDNAYVKAGAFLGQGLSCASYDENVILQLLKPQLENKDPNIRVATILGLGFAHCGKESQDAKEELEPHLGSEQPPMVRAATAIALGMIFVGSQNDEIMISIFQLLEELEAEELENDSCSLFYALCLGLLYFQSEDEYETCLEIIAVVQEKAPKLHKTITVVVEACAFAGTGNVLQIQKLLNVCGEHPDKPEKKKDDEENEEEKEEEEKPVETLWDQAIAVLGLAVVAMGEKYGNTMLTRVMNHLVQYGEPSVRRAIPLCLALASVSNPELQITDLLSKLSHDNDLDTVNGAILGLGLVSAGTNNSRVASMLRNLMEYHRDHPDQLFLIRIALGFLHMGKGLLTLSPHHSDGLLISKTSVAGLLTVLVSCLDFKKFLLGSNYHYILYALSVSIRPRMLTVLDEELNPKKIDIRVGTAVDTVCMVGNPRPITAFQTHETPVVLGEGQRADMVNPDKYIPLSPILEGFVIVKENPDYVEED